MNPLSAGMLGYKLGRFGGDLWWGTHAEKLDQAAGFIDDYEQSNFTHEPSLRKAISILEQIPDNEKDYIIAGKYYYLAICYGNDHMYQASLRCLDTVERLEIGTFTACADTLASIKTESKNLRRCIIERMNESTEDVYEEDPQTDDNNDNSRFKAFFDSYLNNEYNDWDVDKRALLFEREGEECSDITVKSMYYCVAAVIRLETFVEEWLVNGFDNYKDTSKEFCQKCLVKGFEDIQISREIIPQDKEYQLVDISFIMLNYFWIEDDEDLENYTSLYDDFLNLEKEETALFNYDWLVKLFKHSYNAILDYCDKNKNQITAEEQEYLDSVKDILEDYGEIGPRERKRLEKDRVRLGISEERAQQLEADLSNPSLTEEEQEYLDEYKEMLEDYEEIGVRERKRLEKLRVRLGISEARAKELEGL